MKEKKIKAIREKLQKKIKIGIQRIKKLTTLIFIVHCEPFNKYLSSSTDHTWGRPSQKAGKPIYYWGKLSRKRHENERIFTERFRGAAPNLFGSANLKSANFYCSCINVFTVNL